MWRALTGNKHVSQPVSRSAMFCLHSRSRMCQMMPSNQRSTKNGSSHPPKRQIARRFTYAVLCCAVIRYKHITQFIIGSLIFYLHSLSPLCQRMPSNQRSIKSESFHPQKTPYRPLVYICSFVSRCDESLLRRATSHERPLFVCQKCAKGSTSEAARPQTQTLDAHPASKSADRTKVGFSSFVQCCSAL